MTTSAASFTELPLSDARNVPRFGGFNFTAISLEKSLAIADSFVILTPRSFK